MFRPKKHVRLTSLPNAPKVADIKSVADEASKARGCTVELPWKNKMTGVPYSLTVRYEVAGGDPMWTLYEGEAAKSRVVWSSPFEDVELLYDVLMLSIPEEVDTGELQTGSHRTQSDAAAQRAAAAASGVLPQPPNYYGEGLLTGNEKLEVPSTGLGFYYQKEGDDLGLLKDDDPPPKKEEKPAAKKEPAKETEKKPTTETPIPQPAQVNPTPPYGTPIPGYQYPPGYPYPQPGYPPQGYPANYYPQGYPGYPPQGYPNYPPGYPPQGAGNVAVQPGQQGPQGTPQSVQPTDQATAAAASRPTDQDLMRPRPNLRLGQFLVEAGLVPESTVDAALQLQELVKSGSLSTAQAAEAVRRAHIRGGAVDPKLIAAPLTKADLKAVAPPLGQILVEAAIIRGPVIRQALKLQEDIRSGSMSKEDALDALCLEVFGVGRKSADKGGETSESTNALELLRKAQLVSDFDHETASKVRDKHGGQLLNILVKAGKLDQHTADGATKCNEYIAAGKLEEGKAIIALHYCQRSRIELASALKELGWEIA